MFIGKGPPFRPICGGWPRPHKPGRCFQHHRRADASIPFWENTTVVPDKTDPPGADIAPYARHDPTDHSGGTGSCGIAPPDCEYLDRACDRWLDARFNPVVDRRPNACPSPDATHATVDHNCFHKNGTVDLSQCEHIGQKRIRAHKSHHGRYGFLNPDNVYEPISIIPSDYWDPTCSCGIGFQPEITAVDHRKYRTEQVTEVDKGTGGDSSWNFNLTSSRTVTVGRLTGRRTMDAFSDSYTPGSGQPPTPTPAALGDSRYSPPEPKALQDCINLFYGVLNGVLFTPVAADLSGSPGEWTLNRDDRDGSGNGNVFFAELSRSGGYAHRTRKIYGSLHSVDGQLIVEEHENIDLTNTSSSYYYSYRDQLEYEIYGIGLHEHTITAALTNPYDCYDRAAAGDDAYKDLATMLANWSLLSHTLYPFDHSEFTTIAPLITYDEALRGVDPIMQPGQIFNNLHNASYPGTPDDDAWIAAHLDTWVEEGYADSGAPGGTGLPNPPAYTGNLRGSPNPAGYAGHFDWQHVTWRACHDDLDMVQFFTGISAFGSKAGATVAADGTDDVIPPAATQWTDNHTQSDSVPPDAWLQYNPELATLWGQKLAEVKVPRPSYNFFGPCGPDRFLYKEDLVGCVDTYDSGSKTVTLLYGGVPGITSGTGAIYGIDPAVDGVWTFNRTNDTTYVLTGTRLRTGSAGIPAGVKTFGKLRYPDAWPICGRVTVLKATQAGGNIDLQISPAPELRPGDHLDFTGVTGLGSNVAVATVTDEENLTVPGTLSGAYTGGGFAQSHGSPLYWWFDQGPKGSYIFCTWTHNFRDYSERVRVQDQYANCNSCAAAAPADSSDIRPWQFEHGMPRSVAAFTVEKFCLRYSKCAPQVMAISPNAEAWPTVDTFLTGRTHDFPALFPGDGRYGSLWQAAFIQTLVHPFWEDPHKPCDLQAIDHDPEADPTTWNEDNGSGQPDADPNFYYPHRPYIEPEIALPVVSGNTAPALPADAIQLGYLALAALNVSSAPVTGNVLPPPAIVGSDEHEPVPHPNPTETPWSIYLIQQANVCAKPPGRFAENYREDLVLCP